uniref:J domain-containing protein n=1 Tax=Leersia perrieri TaxID=77586 RepID=A0A0D9VDB4_9ORYZ
MQNHVKVQSQEFRSIVHGHTRYTISIALRLHGGWFVPSFHEAPRRQFPIANQKARENFPNPRFPLSSYKDPVASSAFPPSPFFTRIFHQMGRKKKARVSRDGDEEEPEPAPAATESRGLYEILGIERTASQQDIKKAYYKLALRLHPDKNPGDEEAKEKFQQLQKVIAILGDEEKRALYDETGITDDDALVGEAADNLQEYFRTVYRKVTEADIEEFEAKYRGSDSEKKDLKDLYTQLKGNMNRLFCSMICSDPKLDSHRFKDIIDEAIAEGELKSTKAYEKWSKKISEIEPPTNPLERRVKKKKKTEENDLILAISQRREQRKDRFNSVLSSIMSKCDAKGSSSSAEPTEEEFERARQRLEKKRAKNHK